MAKIHILKKIIEGVKTAFYPLTIPQAVIDPTSGKSARAELDEKANHGYETEPKTLKEVDDSVVQLAGDVSLKIDGKTLTPQKLDIANNLFTGRVQGWINDATITLTSTTLFRGIVSVAQGDVIEFNVPNQSANGGYRYCFTVNVDDSVPATTPVLFWRKNNVKITAPITGYLQFNVDRDSIVNTDVTAFKYVDNNDVPKFLVDLEGKEIATAPRAGTIIDPVPSYNLFNKNDLWYGMFNGVGMIDDPFKINLSTKKYNVAAGDTYKLYGYYLPVGGVTYGSVIFFNIGNSHVSNIKIIDDVTDIVVPDAATQMYIWLTPQSGFTHHNWERMMLVKGTEIIPYEPYGDYKGTFNGRDIVAFEQYGRKSSRILQLSDFMYDTKTGKTINADGSISITNASLTQPFQLASKFRITAGGLAITSPERYVFEAFITANSADAKFGIGKNGGTSNGFALSIDANYMRFHHYNNGVSSAESTIPAVQLPFTMAAGGKYRLYIKKGMDGDSTGTVRYGVSDGNNTVEQIINFSLTPAHADYNKATYLYGDFGFGLWVGSVTVNSLNVSLPYQFKVRGMIWGDSFVEGNSLANESKPKKYAARIASDLGADNFVILGKGGEKFENAVSTRIRGELAWFDAKYGICALGVNNYADVALNGYQVTVDLCIAKMQEFATIMQAHGVVPVFLTPFAYGGVPAATTFYAELSNWIRNSGHKYVDVNKALSFNGLGLDWVNANYQIGDNIHPSADDGHLAIYNRFRYDLPELFD